MQSVADPGGGKIAPMNPPRYVHLRLHSEYSVTDGIVRVDDAIKRAAGDGMPALALTDLGNLFGLVKFYTGARGKGVKPIAGADVWIANPESPEDAHRLLLLARNRTGYRQLCELLTRAYLVEGRRDRAEIRREWFAEIGSDGLIALSGAHLGDVGEALINGNFELAGERARAWAAIFPDAFYLEVQRYGQPQQEADRPADRRSGRRAGAAAGRHAPDPVLESRRLQGARSARLHRRRLCAGRQPAAEDLHRRAVFQDAGRDGRAVRRSAGSAGEFAGNRPALQYRNDAGQELPARLPDPAGHDARRIPRRRGRGRA